MAPSVLEAIKTGRTYETKLSNYVASSHVSPAGLVDILEHIQSSSKAVLLLDLEVAIEENVEERLWNSHQRVHNYYRADIAKLRDSKRIVEQRKLSGHYIKFLKTSQSFYRGYIWGLKQAYGEIPELDRCAQAVRPHDQQNSSQTLGKANQGLVLRSCHRSLVQLGDLSRYRENANPDKERKWGPAIGYYELAESILPTSGYPGNQLAVLQLLIGNNFKAIYHLYRSLVADEPHPQANDNIRKLYSKLRSGWESGASLQNDNATSSAGASKMMLVWYLRRLEVSYHGRVIPSHSELEDEVNTRLMEDLRQGRMDPTLRRIVLINCAAAYQLRNRIPESSSGTLSSYERSYITFIRFVMKVFMTLLAIFEHELGNISVNDAPLSTSEASGLSNRITTKMEDILPSIRLYALWLHAEAATLERLSHEDINSCRFSFWMQCARCFSLLVEKFPPELLANLNNKDALPEDFDILGFKPLQCSANEWVLYPDGPLKVQPYETAPKGKSNPENNLTRIRDILSIAVSLSQQSDVAFSLDPSEGKFVYIESGTHGSSSTSMIGSLDDNTRAHPGVNEDPPASSSRPRVPAAPMEVDAPSTTIHDIEAERMVDDLVGTVDDVNISRSIDPLPGHSEPTTPLSIASHLQNRAIDGSGSSSFPIGPQTADDLLEAVQNYSRQRKTEVASGGSDYKASRSTSQLHSPSMGQQSARLSPSNAGASATSTSSAAGAAGSISRQHRISPSIDNYQSISPLAPPARLTSHSRGNSNESINSMPNNIWSTGTPIASWTPSRISNTTTNSLTPAHLGNGTFGTMANEVPSGNTGTMSYRNQVGFSGAGSNPWTARPQQLPEPSRITSSTGGLDGSQGPWNASNHGTTSSRILGEPFASRVEVRSTVPENVNQFVNR